HPQRADRGLVAGLHGGGHVGNDGCLQFAHGKNSTQHRPARAAPRANDAGTSGRGGRLGAVPHTKTFAFRRPLPTLTTRPARFGEKGETAGAVGVVKRIALVTGGVVGGLGLAGAATFLYANQIELKAFRVKRVRVPALPAGSGPLRILHLSDFHMTRSQRKKQRWIAGLEALQPDLVVDTGDNLGGADAVPGVLTALGPLLNRPGVFVFGTNDDVGPKPLHPLRYLTGKKRKPSTEKLPWERMRAALIDRG